MSTFERIHQTEAPRESITETERGNIEMTDADYLQRLRRDTHAMDIDSALRNCEPSEMNPMMPEALNCLDRIERRKDAKSKSKAPKSKPKKDAVKRNKAAVARVQEKL